MQNCPSLLMIKDFQNFKSVMNNFRLLSNYTGSFLGNCLIYQEMSCQLPEAQLDKGYSVAIIAACVIKINANKLLQTHTFLTPQLEPISFCNTRGVLSAASFNILLYHSVMRTNLYNKVMTSP